MKKVLVTAHLGRHFTKFGHADYQVLLQMGYEVHIAANFSDPVDNFNDKNVIMHQVNFQRNPFSLKNIHAYAELKKIVEKEKFDLIHTHSPSGGAITRLASTSLRKKGARILYTAHGFHFYKGAPKLNWIIYYNIEKMLARFTDIIITINREDYTLAHRFNTSKIEYVPGVGIDLSRLKNVNVDKTMKSSEFQITEDSVVLISVGELNKNKNHEVVIKAIANVSNVNIKYIICGDGEKEQELYQLATELGIEKQVLFLGHRKDILELLKIADIFLMPSYREGLSVALMEAMSSGMPVICSEIRGNVDLIDQERGGYLVKPQDVEGFKNSIVLLTNNKQLRINMGTYNYEKIKDYDIELIKSKMKEIYERAILS